MLIVDWWSSTIGQSNRQSTITNQQRIRNQRSPITNALLRLLVRRVLPAEATELAELEPLGRLLLVLRRAVVPTLALAARQLNDVSHCSIPVGIRDPGSGVRVRGQALLQVPTPDARGPVYSMMSVIVPAPTVRPPSRMAKRAPFSSATGVCNSAVIVVLSPGITISTPSGNFNDPVTSVVRM
jgi:hypothetical protein